MPTPGEKLRAAWARGPALVPGTFCPLVAKMAEKLGFPAVYLSGGALSAGNGVPDIGLLTASEFASSIALMANATQLPVLADADTGFGEALNVERTVRMYEQAGAAGLHLEDQQMPKRCGHLSGKSLIEPEAMASKIRAADAVARAKLYLKAGADGIFIEALENEAEFAQFAKDVPAVLLANMTEFGKSPNLDAATLGRLGYKLVLFPLTAFRAAMRAAEATLKDLLENGSQKNSLSNMQTRSELYDLLEYTGYEVRDRSFFQ
jgi:methylisocitrate lyase